MAIEKIEMDTNLLSASDVNGLGGGDAPLQGCNSSTT